MLLLLLTELALPLQVLPAWELGSNGEEYGTSSTMVGSRKESITAGVGGFAGKFFGYKLTGSSPADVMAGTTPWPFTKFFSAYSREW